MILKKWIPPVFLELFRLVNPKGIRLSGRYDSWEKAMMQCTGYDDDGILQKTLDAALEVKEGRRAYSRDSVLFDRIIYCWPILATLMWVAARNSGKIKVLDFGGSLGSTYFQNKKFLEGLNKVSWHIVEQVETARVGTEFIADEILSFSSSLDDAFQTIIPDMAILSSVLQYLQEPFALLSDIAKRNIPVIAMDRTPFLKDDAHTFIQKQSVPSHIYKASYPCHLFNQNEVLNCLGEFGYELLEEFISPDCLSGRATWKGMIFRKMG